MDIIQSHILKSDYISHAFFTRKGGVSKGLYESLNCGPGSKDPLDNVQKNQENASNFFQKPHKALKTVHQIHSDIVISCDQHSNWDWLNRPKGDALVTKSSGQIIGILTADCAPILFADHKNNIIGASHAGWKGALYGVIKNTINAMIELGAERQYIEACIGPCISQKSYEVKQDFYDRFIQENRFFKQFFDKTSTDDSYFFDLKEFAKHQLCQEKIKEIDVLNHDTCAEKDLFYSYRRSCLQNEVDYGRQLSAIALY